MDNEQFNEQFIASAKAAGAGFAREIKAAGLAASEILIQADLAWTTPDATWRAAKAAWIAAAFAEYARA
jgi:hypothetical protein